MKRIFLLALAVLMLLSGCRQTTTIILPPETQSPTEETTAPKTFPATVPTTEPTIPASRPTEAESTEPPTEPPTQPPTAPLTQPPTQPPTQPMAKPPTEPEGNDITGHTISNLEWALLAELNARRAKEGLPSLSLDRRLCVLAAVRAQELTQILSHTRPDGRVWSSVLSDFGYSAQALGENLLYGTSDYTAGAMADTWMKSTDHRNLLLHPDARAVGIGVWEQNGFVYIAVLFIA